MFQHDDSLRADPLQINFPTSRENEKRVTEVIIHTHPGVIL